MGSSKKYNAEDTLKHKEAAQRKAETAANAEAAARGNADAVGGGSDFAGGALAKKRAKKDGSTLAGEGGRTFEMTGTLGG